MRFPRPLAGFGERGGGRGARNIPGSRQWDEGSSVLSPQFLTMPHTEQVKNRGQIEPEKSVKGVIFLLIGIKGSS